MSNTLSKILKIFVAVLFIVTGIITIIYFLNIDLINEEAIKNQLQDYKYVNIFLQLGYILVIATAGVAIISPIFNAIVAPSKKMLVSLIAIVVIVVIVLVSYSMANLSPITLANGDIYNKEFGLKLTDTCLYSAYVLACLTIVSVVFSSIMRLFK